MTNRHDDMTVTLPLERYRDLIDLDAPPPLPARQLGMPVGAAAREVLAHLGADPAIARAGLADVTTLPRDKSREILRAVLTVRGPGPLPSPAQELLDALLAHERAVRPTAEVTDLPVISESTPGTTYPSADRVAVWKGDITTLSADAIVNAANSALLGCFRPFHGCIDNAIHSAAGPRLRNDCAAIISAQGRAEPTGTAKITRGHHLPARFVLHTVGPIVQGMPRSADVEALMSSYLSCLDLAALAGARTVAFCSVSTGVFGFPKGPAARVALDAVNRWLDENPETLDRVVFDVFTEDDLDIYRHTLDRWKV